MSTLTIKDLSKTEDLAHKTMTILSGGMGRTPQQILAWEITHQPATWDGRVLGDDGQLHQPVI